MKYKPIEEERAWYNKQNEKRHPPRHYFAHHTARKKIFDTLIACECNSQSLILDVGCGSGEFTLYLTKLSSNIVGIDVSDTALVRYNIINGFQGILADAITLAFKDETFDYVVISGLLHHLIRQGDLSHYIKEFSRVTMPGGYVVAMEPNLFNFSGLMMNIFNTVSPGITGLVPHERALSPIYLIKIFKESGLSEVNVFAASYVWNRFPLFLSRLIAKYEDKIRYKKPFS